MLQRVLQSGDYVIVSGLSLVFTRTRIAIWAVLTVVATVTGPFGTYDGQAWQVRLLYWAIIVAISVFLSKVIRLAVEYRLRHQPFWLIEAVFTLIVVPILTFAVIVISRSILDVDLERLPNPWLIFFFVFFVTTCVVALRTSLQSFGYLSIADATAKQVIAPRLLDRLDDADCAPILRLSGDGHLVEIVTAAGTSKVRMRLVDAIREMEPVIGYRTHRSHWVAHAAISGVEREAAKTFLCLSNGDRVPVTRKYRASLEEAGVV